ncbi:hypothetical protein DM02DRAFT_537341 [Periconia macrospinosa]|uniref:Uncharacterized protein n=1 Tax=Periconia macrospinosa TaxID=97972 RepID=A0A2V1DBM7_9PLEO|nr:hypothetical protein DM02DRAFT_537341 [Periconia macrospinosa]
MPAEPAPFSNFGITLVTICVPFFSVVGFLSTSFGYSILSTKAKQVYRWLRLQFKSERGEVEITSEDMMKRRLAPIKTKKKRRENSQSSSRERMSYPHIHAMVEQMGEGRQSGLAKMGRLAVNDADAAQESSKDAIIEVKD